MAKPILVVTSRYPKEIENRLDRDYNARRNPDQVPFSQQKLLNAAEGADALFITLADRLDSGFFQKVSPTVKVMPEPEIERLNILPFSPKQRKQHPG
jgi:lactate dehydrogenase-like 2-hydroxyacid dehydrogenase